MALQLKERIMSVHDLITEQDALNALTINDVWKRNFTSDAFLTQAIIESNELICDSGVKYKWWKKHDDVSIDHWNTKIEVIDMLHFLLSSISIGLYQRRIDDKVKAQLSNMYIGTDALSLMNEGIDLPSNLLIRDDGQLDYTNYIQLIRTMMFLDTIEDHVEYVMLSYGCLNALVAAVGLTTQEVSAIYTAKATLNRIRQSSGYKDGSYVKVTKDGVEDNQRLEGLVLAYLGNDTVSLNKLAKAVRDEFFKAA